MQSQWKETMAGGSPEAERAEFAALARAMMLVQLKNAKTASARGVPHPVDRAFHVKSTLATGQAELAFLDLPGDLRHGFAQPGRAYPVIVRFSNAAGTGQSDTAPDLRGVTLRVRVSPEESHDLLMTNFPVSHARDAREFVEFAKATAGGPLARALGVPRLIGLFGLPETVRMLRNVLTARRQTVNSVATTTYWSRGAVRWGPALAVRYLLRPAPGTAPAPAPPDDDPDYLSTEAARRLATGDIRFELCVQRYVDEKLTPIENTAAEWTERASPAEAVAVLTLPSGDLSTASALAQAQVIEKMTFNPWNTTDEFRPLGNLNRARKAVYDASAAQRLGYRWQSDPPVRNAVAGAAVRAVFKAVNRVVPWYRLPVRLGLLNLEGLRYVLRARNLFDSEVREAPPRARAVPPAPPGEEVRVARTSDGTCNDLSAPGMGAAGSAFGRNLRPVLRPDLFDEPSPVLVSRELLRRDTFLPARSLNLLAAAWIQFQVHDWVDHARYPLGEDDIRVPLPPGMTWSNRPGDPPGPEMRIAGNIPFPGPRDNPMSPVFQWPRGGCRATGSSPSTSARRSTRRSAWTGSLTTA